MQRPRVMDLSIETVAAETAFEIAEHKGAGHPDTLCDALAERTSRALSRRYLAEVGGVLHHNVDKALLVGGASRPAFGGGEVVAPIEITIAGRASPIDGGDEAVAELVHDACRKHLRSTFHALDPSRHVVVVPRIRAGSVDLRALFARGAEVPLANDTSIGAGYAPLSAIDRVVLAIGDRLAAASRAPETAFVGEDVKVMGVRSGPVAHVTVACAMVDRHLRSVDDYREAKDVVQRLARDAALSIGSPGPSLHDVAVVVNAADDLARGEVYLTVTGTSAEAGDDGEVGRGNRVNGLITPGRPMSMEAAAGKNPSSHVGKLYNVVAGEVAAAIAGRVEEVARADVLLVSRIGAPIDDPRAANVRLVARPGRTVPASAYAIVDGIVRAHLADIRALTSRIVAGEVRLY